MQSADIHTTEAGVKPCLTLEKLTMVTIHKYQFEINDRVEIEMPERARFLSIQIQSGKPTIWAMVNTDWPLEKRRFLMYGTGHKMNELDLFRTHIGTFQLNGFVWHIFE